MTFVEAFKKFTLWSQHLVLHTRESLEKLLLYAGFKNIIIQGVQRFGLSNHICWLLNAKPGGHKDFLSVLENKNLFKEYSNSLNQINANDTLVAIASL